jgi:hypothetical protein
LTRRISPIALCVVVSLLISTAVALADPAGKDTRDETITFDGGSPFADLSTGAGEDEGAQEPCEAGKGPGEEA